MGQKTDESKVPLELIEREQDLSVLFPGPRPDRNRPMFTIGPDHVNVFTGGGMSGFIGFRIYNTDHGDPSQEPGEQGRFKKVHPWVFAFIGSF